MGQAGWIHKWRSPRFTIPLSPISLSLFELRSNSRLRRAARGIRKWTGAPPLFASRIGILAGAVFTRAASPGKVAPVLNIPAGRLQ